MKLKAEEDVQMKKPVLVIMAAGMGSRYGGLKQIDPVDREGHIIMDFSIYDAKKAGFEKVVFIIKKENEKDFKDAVGRRIEKVMDTAYVYQELDSIPEGFAVPEGRVKPWGTAHAILCAAGEIDSPFAVINADDYYGRSAFEKIYQYLTTHEDDEKYRYTMVGYRLINTVTDNGYVSRGVCALNEKNELVSVTERTRIEKRGSGVAYSEDGGSSWKEIDGNTLVVITASLPTTNNIHRVFWTFKYWGFSNKYVKVLNGANQYIATLNNGSYMETPVYRAIVPTTFSVKELPASKMDSYRASFGEVFDSAKNGLFKEDGSGSSILIPTMANNAAISNTSGTVIARVANNSNAFAGRIRGATQLALDPSKPTDYGNSANLYINTDGRYKTAEEIMPLMTRYVAEGQKAEFLPADKNRRIITHCGSGQSTAPHWFVIREILGYTNAAIYDGSWNEWGNFATFYVKDTTQDFVTVVGAENPADNKTATNYLISNPATYTYQEYNTKTDISTSLGKSSVFKNVLWDTSFYTDYLVLRTNIAKGTASGSSLSAADNEYAGDGREINTADKNYQSGAGDAAAGGNTGGAATGGGSAPAGC